MVKEHLHQERISVEGFGGGEGSDKHGMHIRGDLQLGGLLEGGRMGCHFGLRLVHDIDSIKEMTGQILETYSERSTDNIKRYGHL